MKIRLASDITKDSIVDGPGLRAVLWTQGCPHKCVGCHNPQTHDTEGGVEVLVSDVIDELYQLRIQTGLTISGGEPLAQAHACARIAKHAKRRNFDVWLFTGYAFERVIKAANTYRTDWAELLKYVDVLVDGPYIEEKRDELLRFRGSTNQRVIDVKKTFMHGRIILFEEEEQEKEYKVSVG